MDQDWAAWCARMHVHGDDTPVKNYPLGYGQIVIERRTLGIAEHCAWCTHLSDLGWQLAGVLPVPGESDDTWEDDQCLSNCRCDLESKIVTYAQAEKMIETPVAANEVAKQRAAVV